MDWIIVVAPYIAWVVIVYFVVKFELKKSGFEELERRIAKLEERINRDSTY